MPPRGPPQAESRGVCIFAAPGLSCLDTPQEPACSLAARARRVCRQSPRYWQGPYRRRASFGIGKPLPSRSRAARWPGNGRLCNGRRCHSAMGQRNVATRRATLRRGDAGHDLVGNSRGRKLDRFLATAAEDEGIASLQPHHASGRHVRAHQYFIYFVLRDGMRLACLPTSMQRAPAAIIARMSSDTRRS